MAPLSGNPNVPLESLYSEIPVLSNVDTSTVSEKNSASELEDKLKENRSSLGD